MHSEENDAASERMSSDWYGIHLPQLVGLNPRLSIVHRQPISLFGVNQTEMIHLTDWKFYGILYNGSEASREIVPNGSHEYYDNEDRKSVHRHDVHSRIAVRDHFVNDAGYVVVPVLVVWMKDGLKPVTVPKNR